MLGQRREFSPFADDRRELDFLTALRKNKTYIR